MNWLARGWVAKVTGWQLWLVRVARVTKYLVIIIIIIIKKTQENGRRPYRYVKSKGSLVAEGLPMSLLQEVVPTWGSTTHYQNIIFCMCNLTLASLSPTCYMENRSSKKPGHLRTIILPLLPTWVNHKLPMGIFEIILASLSLKDFSVLSLNSKTFLFSLLTQSTIEDGQSPPFIKKYVGTLEMWNFTRPYIPYISCFGIFEPSRVGWLYPRLFDKLQKAENFGYRLHCLAVQRAWVYCQGHDGAKALIKSLNFDKVENWMADLKWSKIDVFLGLLFSTFTNLRRLHLSMDYQYVCQVQFSQSLGRSVAKTSLCALEIAEFGRGTLFEYSGTMNISFTGNWLWIFKRG